MQSQLPPALPDPEEESWNRALQEEGWVATDNGDQELRPSIGEGRGSLQQEYGPGSINWEERHLALTKARAGDIMGRARVFTCPAHPQLLTLQRILPSLEFEQEGFGMFTGLSPVLIIPQAGQEWQAAALCG